MINDSLPVPGCHYDLNIPGGEAGFMMVIPAGDKYGGKAEECPRDTISQMSQIAKLFAASSKRSTRLFRAQL